MTPRVRVVGDCVERYRQIRKKKENSQMLCVRLVLRERVPIIMFVLGSFLKSRKMVFGWRRREEEVTTKETTVGVLTPFSLV